MVPFHLINVMSAAAFSAVNPERPNRIINQQRMPIISSRKEAHELKTRARHRKGSNIVVKGRV